MATAIEYGLIVAGFVVVVSVGVVLTHPTPSPSSATSAQSVAPCVPLQQSGESCIGAIIERTNGTVTRVWFETDEATNNISPADAADLKRDGKIAQIVGPSNPNFTTYAGRYAIQMVR